MRIKLSELMAETGVTKKELSRLLWPDSDSHTQAVSIHRWLKYGTVSIRLDQLKALSEHFTTTKLEKLIDYEPGTNE